MTEEKKQGHAAAISARARAAATSLSAMQQPLLDRADELAQIVLAALSDSDSKQVAALIKKGVDARRLLSRLG